MRQKPHARKSASEVPAEDTSPVVYQKGKLKSPLFIKEIKWTDKQKEFIDLALNKNTKIMIVDGAAGTGKSILAVYCSLMLMNMKKISDLVYIRSTTQSQDGATGFLQGDLNSKMEFFNIPLYDKLNELLEKPDIQKLEKEDRVILYPTSFLRGYNFAVRAVIGDEIQNWSFDSITTLATRMGEYSKLFLVGDSKGQNDYGNKSGFRKFTQIFNDEESRENGIVYFNFTSEDIMRSGTTKFVVQKLEQYNAKWDISA